LCEAIKIVGLVVGEERRGEIKINREGGVEMNRSCCKKANVF
jgi:hypothetical protein